MAIKIIFVDDEIRVLEGLKRSFRNMRDDWDMSFASSGKEALALIADTRFDVIVSDMDMPEMTGDALLNQVKIDSPETARIVLTGAATKEKVFRLLGSDHFFLSKPCPRDVFIQTVEKALDLHFHVKEIVPGVIENEPLSNEDLTLILEDFFRGQLLKGAIGSEDVPFKIRSRLSNDLVNFFAPVVETPDYLPQFVDTSEYDGILNGWLDAGDSDPETS